MKKYLSIGIMSGSSLDGLDIALCSFEEVGSKWSFQLIEGSTIEFPDRILHQLKICRDLSSSKLMKLDLDLGVWIGTQVNNILSGHSLKVDLIGNHGHTVFHDVEGKWTLQIGNNHMIAKTCEIPTISDFRSMDILLGGQGAPLVPIGDEHLFGAYDACINLGGIANLSFKYGGRRIAGDICPLNQILNELIKREGLPYDDNGVMARSGNLIEDWLDELDRETYYHKEFPKSISNEWVADKFLDRLPQGQTKDLLHTFCHFASKQIGKSLAEAPVQSAMITGGGAFNGYLVELIRNYSEGIEIHLPPDEIIGYKEAIVFALMAVLRYENRVNVLSSSTGAVRDHSAGVIFNP